MEAQDFIYIKQNFWDKKFSNENLCAFFKSYSSVYYESTCVEIIDSGKHKVVKERYLIQQSLRKKINLPFEFIYHLN